MKFRQKTILSLLLCIALCLPLSAQQVNIPDFNLRAAVREALNLPVGAPLTQPAMRQLKWLKVPSKQIQDLKGLEYAINIDWLDLADNQITDLSPLAVLTRLEVLVIGENPISDLSPLTELTQLSTLYAWECKIGDISPLANLTRLKYLDLNVNRIMDISALTNLTELIELSLGKNYIRDISPLANTTKLKYLNVYANWITDVSPLSGLNNLESLYISQNKTADHSALNGLPLVNFEYDSICDMPSLPLTDRLERRTYPSIFTYWGHIVNKPHLALDVGETENIAMHDLICCFDHHLVFLDAPNGVWMGGLLEDAIRQRDEWLALNPNMLFIINLELREAPRREYPDDWPYWLRDAQGRIAPAALGSDPSDPTAGGLIDFTHPGFQDRVVAQAVAASKCGLFDGIFFDWWHDDIAILHDGGSLRYVGAEAEQRARDNIIQRIRAETRLDFLIMGNTNDRIIPRTGQYLNGAFMEGAGDSPKVEDSLQWLENNLRSPQINALQGESLLTEAPDSPNNLRRMRAVTTLSLTHSDGYSVFVIGSGDDHYWYDFWDADLGRPVGPKTQLYDEDIPGLYIREFTNGWAVYNHSGAQQVVTLPEEVQAVAGGWAGTEHVLPNLDGEMYLKAVVSDQSPVTSRNPADVNGDGIVNILDLVVVAQALGTDKAEGDVNGDGVVNVFDLVFVAGEMQ